MLPFGLRPMALTFVAAGREPSGVAAEMAEVLTRSRPNGLSRSAKVNTTDP